MNQIDKSNLTPEQLEQLSQRFGNKVQTLTFELTVAFNDLHGFTEGANLPAERVAAGIKEILGILWHVPATGADKHIPAEGHKETCRTRDKDDLVAAFRECNCGAYGEEGPPRDMWSLLSRFIKVVPQTSKVEFVDACPTNHTIYGPGDVCPTCGETMQCFHANLINGVCTKCGKNLLES